MNLDLGSAKFGQIPRVSLEVLFVIEKNNKAADPFWLFMKSELF